MAQLLDLPPELLIHAFAYLPFDSLVSLLSLSRLVNELVSTSVVLQYLILLGSSSHCNNPTTTSVAHNLQVLRQGEEGWSEWKVQKLTCLGIKYKPSSIYDLTCGILILGEAGPGRTTTALQWVDLRRGGDMEWNRFDLQANIVDLALNVHECDLIAVITTRIVSPNTCLIQLHLLQLSASKDSNARPHRLASQPVLPILSYHVRHGRCALSMEVVGPHLALLLTFPYSIRPVDKLYIFDWKTGKMLFTRQAERLTYNSLTFLSEDVLLLPNLTDNVLELCSLSCSQNTSMQSVEPIFDDCEQVSPDFATAIPLRTAVTLKLPALAPHIQLAMFACRGEPTPYSATYEPPVVEGAPLFRPRSESAIVIFNMILEDDTPLRFGQVSPVSLVVHRQALLDQINSKEQKNPSSSTLHHLTDQLLAASSLKSISELEKRIVSWTEWGPHVTRWFLTDDMSTRWITTTCGQRWVTIEDGRPSSIFIRDFNPVNVKRVMANLGGPGSYETDEAVVWVVDAPSALSVDLDNTFGEHVESRLPYLEIETKEKFTYSSVFMSENWLLGILIDEADHSMDRVDVYSMI